MPGGGHSTIDGSGSGARGAETDFVDLPPVPNSQVGVSQQPTVLDDRAPRDEAARRRRTAGVVVLVAIVAGVIGGFVGHRIQSPADRAAASAAPEPSLIAVPVELRSLSSELVLAGQVAYNEPTVVQLAGSVGIGSDEVEVVTDLRQVGDSIAEGDVVVEVTGRPVIVLQGELPMYRRLVVGSEGPDVRELEDALARMGYAVGAVDTVFDAATATAVEQMYIDAGYLAEGPTADERDALDAARDSARAADGALRDARTVLADASKPMLASERLQLERAVDQARAAVPAAEAAAATARTEGAQNVAAAQAGVDAATVARNGAVAARDAARGGGTDPDTGEPYTADGLAALDVAVADANEALATANAALTTATAQRDESIATADQAIGDAEFQRELAETQYSEATASADTGALQAAVAAAETTLDAANADLAALEASTGLRISPGEILFVPVLPSSLTESYVALGSTVQGPIGTLATSSTLVSARVSRVDSGLVSVGAHVSIEIRGSGLTTSGTVLSVGAPPATSGGQSDGDGQPAIQEGGSGRLEVVITPDDPDAVADYVFWDARVVITVDSTDGEVLVVPVAALTVGPDEVSQVEVERRPATDDSPAVTELVDVEVGLTADGLAEVSAIGDGVLDEGDRVVIGVETNERQNESDVDESEPPAGEDADTGDAGEDDEGGGDDSADVSPLAELLGWTSNPVEDRRRQLEVEERTADCMRELGYEYEPVDYSSQSSPEDELQWTDPASFGEKYGYGIMRNYELYEAGGADMSGGPEFVDPNQDYVESLGPDEQQAYFEALYGTGAMADASFEDGSGVAEAVQPTPEEMGCSGQASAEVYGDQTLDPEVQSALDDYFTTLRDDPRLATANDDWAACMGETFEAKGVDPEPASPDEMWGVMEGFKAEAMGLEVVTVSSNAELEELWSSGEMVYTATTDEDGRGVAYVGEPVTLDGDEIDRLTAIEVELWQQDQTCQDAAHVAEIQRELETDLVDQLQSRFPDLADR